MRFLKNADRAFKGGFVKFLAECGDAVLAALHETARQFGAAHLRRMFADDGLDALPVSRFRSAAGVGVAEYRLQFGESGKSEALGEAHDGRRLYVAGMGDVENAGDDHILAMLRDVLSNRFQLLGKALVGLRNVLNQVFDAVFLLCHKRIYARVRVSCQGWNGGAMR